MKKFLSIVFLLLFTATIYAQNGYQLKTNLYRDILEFALKANNINQIANGIEKVGFNVHSRSNSDDGRFSTTQYSIGDDEYVLITKSRFTSDTETITFLHQTDIFNFVINYLNSNANVYKPNQIWYNRHKNTAFTYSVEDNTVAVLQIVKL